MGAQARQAQNQENEEKYTKRCTSKGLFLIKC